MTYRVALCGLTVRDQRLSEIVIARAPNPKYRYQVGPANELGAAHIAVVDTASRQGEGQLAELRTLNPALIPVLLSDHGDHGHSRYRIERRSLLLRLTRVLDEVVESEFLHARAVPPTPALASADVGADELSDSAFVEAFEAASDTSLQPLHALIVEANPSIREQLRLALKRVGVHSHPVATAESAYREIRSNSYDLVLLDVSMTDIDGFEVCRNIKKNAYTASIPVMMLTASTSPFDRARGALAGCDAYLLKPIIWAPFFNVLDQVLTKHFRHDRALLSARGYHAVGTD